MGKFGDPTANSNGEEFVDFYRFNYFKITITF
jgi:hypothetical protein